MQKKKFNFKVAMQIIYGFLPQIQSLLATYMSAILILGKLHFKLFYKLKCWHKNCIPFVI